MSQITTAQLPDSHHDPHHDGGGKRRISWLSLLTDYTIVWVVVALFVILALTTPNFLTQANMRNILAAHNNNRNAAR